MISQRPHNLEFGNMKHVIWVREWDALSDEEREMLEFVEKRVRFEVTVKWPGYYILDVYDAEGQRATETYEAFSVDEVYEIIEYY